MTSYIGSFASSAVLPLVRILGKSQSLSLLYGVDSDPVRVGVTEVIRDLKTLGITVKVITGDNMPVATSLTRKVLGYEPQVITGKELHSISNEALRSRANMIDVFAEIEPSQKERIIMALRQSGNTVGFLGDGINDASALHAADVGISVNSAVDIAKEAAAVVLLEGVCHCRAHLDP